MASGEGTPEEEAIKEAIKEERRRVARERDWIKGFDLAEYRRLRSPYPPLVVELDEHKIPVVVGKGPYVTSCAVFQDRNTFCTRYAGQGTLTPGTGPCRYHGGNSYKERVGGAFVTAHAIAAILDVTSSEAIEVALRRAYAWSAWYNAKLSLVTDDDDLRPGGAAYDWVKGAERTTDYVVRYAKIAHDMNIEERHIRAIELEGAMIAQLLATTLHELGLSQDTEDRARAIMETQLRMLAERGEAKIIRGELSA